MVSTRPDIIHTVGVVSRRFMKNPGKEHWEAVKYLKCVSNYYLCFGHDNIDVRGYADSDHAGDRDNERSSPVTSLQLVESQGVELQSCKR